MKSLLFAAFLFVATSAWAEFRVPPLTGPVVDEAGILSRQAEAVIESALRALYEKGGTQITVLTVRSLEGLTIEEASIRVVDQWQLGKRGADRGVLFLIALNERRMRIEVGRGLEGDLTDVESKRIIEDSVQPLFRAGDFDSGVIVGVYQIARKTDPGIDLRPFLEGRARRVPTKTENELPPAVTFILILFFIFMLFAGRRNRRLRPRRMRGSWDTLGGYGGSSWGGRGGWGGGSGGGWRGGGGGFAGGGASGGW